MPRMKKECGSKVPHETEQKARIAIKKAMREFRQPLDCYQCNWCGKWHLTKLTQVKP